MRKGLYQLLIKLDKDEVIPVGKLGTFSFPAGFYVYTGSAMSGLDARIARHLSKTKRFHWHIDYLLERSAVIRYAIRELEGCPAERPEGSLSLECQLNLATLALEGAKVLVKGFGSSDCKCRAHLAYFEREPSNLVTFEHSNAPVETTSEPASANGRKPI